MTKNRILLTQGQHEAHSNPDIVLTTLLGSCVGCCLWDAEAKVGGMNHMLLAVQKCGREISDASGVNAMELLINDIMRLGGERSRLEAKVFGGAQMRETLPEIGRMNSHFVLDFLACEGIPCISQSIGGTSARQVQFWPTSGNARQKITQKQPVEKVLRKPTEVEGNGLDLF